MNLLPTETRPRNSWRSITRPRNRCPRPRLVLRLLLGVLVASCSPTEKNQTSSTPALTPELRRRYMDTTLELGCLSRREQDPRRLADHALAIYRRHGFEQVMDYFQIMQTIGQEKAVQQELLEALRSCP